MKLPSVLTQTPPPWQMLGSIIHSLISWQVFPSVLARPTGQSQSSGEQRVQGLPQARPREQQHSDLRLVPGRLASHCPSVRSVQQVPSWEEIQNLPVESRTEPGAQRHLKLPAVLTHSPPVQASGPRETHSSSSSH